MAILSFKDRQTEDFFTEGILPPKRVTWHRIKKAVLKKLDIIEAAKNLGDLRAIPGNHFKELQNSFYSIRINRQWRIIFKWTTGGAKEVEITDYH